MNQNDRPDFDPAQITAAILAGGVGRRVGGRDKGLLALNGRPIISYVIDSLKDQAARIIVCANRNGDRYREFGDVIVDEVAGFHGPLAGISTALFACETPWLLTLPVDCPAPPKALAQRLFIVATEVERKIAVAFDGTRRQPLFALYRRDLADSARRALDSNDPVWRWQDACGAIEANFSDRPDALENLNSDAEFRAWEQRRHD
jgi:molybdenum cofactor guanylyltransferase